MGVSDKLKVMRVFLGGEKNRPKLLITYKVNHRRELIKEKITFWIDKDRPNGERFKGTTPLVFVRDDLLNDLDTLNIANLFIRQLPTINTEEELLRLYGKLKRDKIKPKYDIIKELKRGFDDENRFIKKPDYGYSVIKPTTFEQVIREKSIKIMQDLQQK